MYYALIRCSISEIEDPKLIGLYGDIKKAEEKLYSVVGKTMTNYLATDPTMIQEFADKGQTRLDEDEVTTYLFDGIFEYFILPFESENIYD